MSYRRYCADWRKPAVIALREPCSLFSTCPEVSNVGLDYYGFRASPDIGALAIEFEAFVEILHGAGCRTHALRRVSTLALDALYVRDCIAITPSGLVACRMSKANRVAEPGLAREDLQEAGYDVPFAIDEPGRLEGGDVVWITDDLCAIAISYRTNSEGARQFGDIVGSSATCLLVPLPHFSGPGQILHLSSLISPIDQTTCIACVRYLPVTFLNDLANHGVHVLPIFENEFGTLAPNVLSLGDRSLLVLAGNAQTSAMLRSNGFNVRTFVGDNISLLGDGGPTCLTRPLVFE